MAGLVDDDPIEKEPERKPAAFPVARAMAEGRRVPSPKGRDSNDNIRVEVNLQRLHTSMSGQFSRDRLDEISHEARFGMETERRDAVHSLAAWAKIRDGSIDKLFIKKHPTIYLDQDGDAWERKFSGAHIPEVDLKGTPWNPAYDKSRERKGAEVNKNMLEKEKERRAAMKPDRSTMRPGHHKLGG